MTVVLETVVLSRTQASFISQGSSMFAMEGSDLSINSRLFPRVEKKPQAKIDFAR